MRRIVDVFVRDTLRGSYPVVLETGGPAPSENEFANYVREALDRGAYSAADVKAARFVVREAGTR